MQTTNPNKKSNYRVVHTVKQPTKDLMGVTIPTRTIIRVDRKEGWIFKSWERIMAYKVPGAHHAPDTYFDNFGEVTAYLTDMGVQTHHRLYGDSKND
jgi:hypothetical protein